MDDTKPKITNYLKQVKKLLEEENLTFKEFCLKAHKIKDDIYNKIKGNSLLINELDNMILENKKYCIHCIREHKECICNYCSKDDLRMFLSGYYEILREKLLSKKERKSTEINIKNGSKKCILCDNECIQNGGCSLKRVAIAAYMHLIIRENKQQDPTQQKPVNTNGEEKTIQNWINLKESKRFIKDLEEDKIESFSNKNDATTR
mmetsp:Transcript_5459/g.8061  ORF Transcript_5459/g.8061 Transcript_5459/m.8061 type:complete len:205 (+) Transcript_5459:62-676(+)